MNIYGAGHDVYETGSRSGGQKMDQDPRQSEPSRRLSDGQIQVLKTLTNPMTVDVGLSVIERDAIRAALARIAALESIAESSDDTQRCVLQAPPGTR